MDKIRELFKEVTGKEFSDEQIKILKVLSDDARETLEKALDVFKNYKADMPQDLLDAVGDMSKQATGVYPYPVSDTKDEEVLDQFLEKYKKEIETLEKAGKKLSKDNIEKIKAVLKGLKDLLPAIKVLEDMMPEGAGIKKDDDSDSNVDWEKEREKIVKEVSEKSTEGLEAVVKQIKELSEAIQKSNKKMEERVKTLEETKGIKKGLDGEGDADDDGASKSDVKWPSFEKAFAEEE